MSDLRKIKRIPQRQRDIVYGYIKEIQSTIFPNSNNNPYFNINQLIKDLCLLYLHEFKDCWTVNNQREFDYVGQKYGDWYHIFGEQVVRRGIINEYKWVIETKGDYSGRIGVVDDTNGDGVASIKDGQGMYATNCKNVICAGNVCKATTWYGNVYGITNENKLAGVFDAEDTLTITINYKDDTITFDGKKKGSHHVEKLQSSTKCMRLVAEFTKGNLFRTEVDYNATITIL